MTNDEVVACLIEVQGLATRDEDFAMGIHEPVDENAVVLEQVIPKLANLELQMAAMVTTADVNTGDIGKVKGYAEQEDARLDKQLRIELVAMSSHLETNNTELMGKPAALETIVAQVQMGDTSSSAEPPGLAGLDGLKSTVAAMEEQFRVTLPKVIAID